MHEKDLRHQFESAKGDPNGDATSEILSIEEFDGKEELDKASGIDETSKWEKQQAKYLQKIEEFNSGVCAIWLKVVREMYDVKHNFG